MSELRSRAVSGGPVVPRKVHRVDAIEGLETRSLLSVQGLSSIISVPTTAEVSILAVSGHHVARFQHGSHASTSASPTNNGVVTAAISPLANRFTAFVNSLDVTSNWQPGTAVDWYSGKPTTAFVVGQKDTHCSAFASSVADRLGINLLRPYDHDASTASYDGQEYLANAQNFWLNGSYNPRDPHDPSPADEFINANVQTAASAGWANVSTRLPTNATPYQLALQAQNLANSGYLVVASVLGNQNYVPGNAPPSGPGHIAVLMPAALTQAQLTNTGPAEAQSGAHNYALTSLETGFADHLPQGTTQIVQVIGATTSYTNPKIQFFFYKNPVHLPPGSVTPSSVA